MGDIKYTQGREAQTSLTTSFSSSGGTPRCSQASQEMRSLSLSDNIAPGITGTLGSDHWACTHNYCLTYWTHVVLLVRCRPTEGQVHILSLACIQLALIG